MAERIPAKAVEVAKFFQAHCRVEGCGWLGDLTDSYQEANDTRQEHLDEHRNAMPGQPPAVPDAGDMRAIPGWPGD